MKFTLPFPEQCVAAGLQEPLEEFRFALEVGRKWRFDFAWPEFKVAVEKEGGLFGRGKECPLCGQRRVGAHTSIVGLLDDLAKYNAASLLGWVVLRCTPKMMDNGEALALVERFFQSLKKE